MVLSNFRLNIILRILITGMLISLLVICLFKTNWTITPFLLFMMICVSTAELIWYTEKANREFSDFLLSIKSSDFSKYYETDGRGKSFSNLKNAFNIIIDEFQSTRVDREAHYTYLQTVIEHLNTAIIAFNDKGEINMINNSAKLLLQTSFLNNINTLQKINPALYKHLVSDNNEILEINIGGEHLKLLIRSAGFKIQETNHKLILIQNIKSEIERTEIEAWEQLLHVLTHEIMNSLTPISSLSATIKKKMDEHSFDKTDETGSISDMLQGLQIIENRSKGLMEFVNHYKSMITLPTPDFKDTNIRLLFERVQTLVSKQMEAKGIDLRIYNRSTCISKQMDVNLIEQVLLNLVNNASDAVRTTTEPYIELSCEMLNGKTIINVTDNGQGIDADMFSKIFIPFFTTKKHGSGVGLSLSRQIMRLHNGTINVSSTPGHLTIFSLEFP